MNNPAPQIIDLPEPPAAPLADSPPRSRSGHTRTGKIARLPKAIRDQLDQMLEDGATVDQIKDTLGDAVRNISPNCFSEWKKGGHLDWRNDQFWRQEMRLRQEAFTDILEGADPVKLPEAGLQVTTTAICDLLRDLCEADADDQKTRVEKHVRIANAMSRLSRSILQLQQYRETCARDKAVELKQRDINEDLSDNEYELLTARMDQVFRRPRKRPAAAPPATEAHSSDFAPLGKKDSSSSSSSFSSSNPPPPSSSSSSSAAVSVPLAPMDGSATAAPADGGAGVSPALNNASSSLAAPERSEGGPSASVCSSADAARGPGTAISTNVHPLLPLPAGEGRGEGNFSTVPTPRSDASPSVQSSVGLAKEGPRPSAPEPAPCNGPTPSGPSSFIPHPSSFPQEHCLECNAPLPNLLPNGTRPRPHCDNCKFELPPPGTCVEPALEQCDNCLAKLPRLLPNGQRALNHCHHCNAALPPPLPVAAT